MARKHTGYAASEYLRERDKTRERDERLMGVKLEAEKKKELEIQALRNEGGMLQQELVSKTALEERKLANQGAFSSEILRNKGEMARKLATSPLDQSQIDYNKVLHDYTLTQQQAEDADLAKRQAAIQEALSVEGGETLKETPGTGEDGTKRLATDAILPRLEDVSILGKHRIPLYGRKKKKESRLFTPSLNL